jgi:group I intron endonuclease
MIKITGVYAIEHIESGRMYIGSTKRSLSRRWSEHRRNLKRKKHHNRHLQDDWNTYGGHAFEFRCIEQCLPNGLIIREQYYLDRYRALDSGLLYNICLSAESSIGRKHSPETKAKLSALNLIRILSPEAQARITAARFGRIVSAETKAKLSAATKAYYQRVREAKESGVNGVI